MARPATPRRSPVPGLKTVISATAVAATLATWAVIAAEQPATAESVPTYVQSSLPAIPTVVPLLDSPPVQARVQVAPLPARPVPMAVTRSSR